MSEFSDLDLARLPRHVAIIMDGNGRWAQQRKKPRLFGHRAGAGSVRDIVEVSAEIGIGVLTLYAFSSENWNRPEGEVSGLMTILKSYLNSELNLMLCNNISLRCIGDMERIPPNVRKVLQNAIERTAGNDGLVLNLALSYGSRDEIVMAAKCIAAKCCRQEITPDQIDSPLFSRHLYTGTLPDPDLFIRTGGEKRLSNFLLWQSSYAEIIFSDVMWPEFRREAYLDCIREFQRRERRFGRTGAQVSGEAS